MGDLVNLEMLNALDLLLIGALLLSAIVGIFRGLTREFLSVLSWALSGWFAQQYRHDVSVYLPDWLKFRQSTVRVVVERTEYLSQLVTTTWTFALYGWRERVRPVCRSMAQQ